MIDFNINTTSTVNKVNAKVELYEGSTLVETCTCNDRLQDFTVERIGLNNKFFGFGVVHKLSVVLIDLERSLTITKDSSFKVYFGYNTFISPYPTFYVAEATRDETTNAISIVAYDKLYAANEATINDLALEAPYTIKDVTQACGAKLGIAETRCGKNLWNNNSFETNTTEDYLTRTETGFIFSRNGSTRGFAVYYSVPVKAGETYTFSCDQVGGARLYIYKDTAYGTALVITQESSATYTFEENLNAVFAVIIDTNIPSLNVSNIQIEKSAIRTSYEPYLAAFDTSYSSGANFEGTEACREVLNAIAEVTQTIYFLNKDEALMFKRLDRGGAPVHTISKDDYYELDSGETRVLAAITNTNELGDSTSVEVDGITGVVQYVRNNPFWELRDDIQLLLTHAGAAIGGIAATPFYCDWDGNFLLEVGDKIALTAEDNSTITSYLLYDTIRYDGILAEATQFIHDGKDETASNPLSLGDALKQTYAKVDKQNKEIQLVASETAANKSNIASLTLDVSGIKLAIESLEDATIGDFTNLTTRVAALELSDTEIKASVEENTKSVEAVETDLATIATELGTTEATLGALQGTVSTNANNIGTLQGTVLTHTTKIGELTTTTESITGRVSAVETTTTNLVNTTGVMETDIKTLDTNLGTVTATVTENKTAIGELKVTTESITASVNGVAERTTELESITEDLDGAITTQNTKITENSTKIGELTTTTESITASVSDITSRTETLETSVETLDGNIQTNTSSIATNTEKIGELEVSTESINAQVSSLETTTTTLTTTTSNLQSDLNDLDSSVSGLDAELGELVDEVGGISTTITEHTEKIAALELDNESITASVSTLNSKTTVLETDLQALDGAVTEQGESIDNLGENVMANNESITINKENIAALQIRSNEIGMFVGSLEETTTTQIGNLEESYEALSKEVALKITDDDLTIAIEEERRNGAERVKTSTGFTFNDDGLTIEKSDSAISTNINEDGLSVFKYDDEVLTADNTGVKAQNLHATTYLIIGNNTYFADFTGSKGEDRAGCFWTGK